MNERALEIQEDIVNGFVEQLLDQGDGAILADYCRKYPSFKDILEQKYQVVHLLDEAFGKEGLAGTEIGEYLIIEEIGRGGMGVVYLALQRSLSRYVALKVLPFGLTLDTGSIKRFQSEAKIIARFNHPNIVPIFSTGEEKGVYYIAMALIPGLSLNKVLEQIRTLSGNELKTATVRDIIQTHPDFTRLNMDNKKTGAPTSIGTARDASFWNRPYHDFVLNLCAEVADALSYAHKSHVCHGDLKPSNIMLSAGGVPIIVDFGLAKDMQSLTTVQSQGFLGTVAYSSPEHINGNAVNEGSDIWSLGVTMYEMITLRQPFHANDVARTVERILKSEPPLIRAGLRGFPKDAEAIVFKCLEKAPGNRYQSAELVKKDINDFMASKPIMARPVGRVGRLFKWSRRNRLLSVFALVLVLSLLITSYAFLNSTIKESIAEGSRYLDAGKYAEALQSFERSLNRLKWNPLARKSKADVLSKIGDAWAGKGAYDKAIDSYEQALQIEPDYIPALGGLGDVYFERGAYQKTIDFYNRVIILSPNDRESYYQRGRAYKEEGLYANALKDLHAAIRIAPNDVDTLKEISGLLQTMGLNAETRRISYLRNGGFNDAEIKAVLQARAR